MLRPITAAVVSLVLVLTAFAADPADPLIAQGIAAMAASEAWLKMPADWAASP